MNNGFVKLIIVVIIGFVVIKACSSSGNDYRDSGQMENWEKSPVDELIKSLSDEQNFSIILYDMDAGDSGDSYKHKYRVVVEKPDTVQARETEWYPVSAGFFKQHLNDMGMEIASKKDGVVHKQAAPAGYTNYVGNQKYGHWVNRNGSSFWEFYGKYAFLSSMFNMMSYPVRRSYWDDYYGGYYGRGRSYYGPSGRTIYGTKNYTSSSSGRNTTWASKPPTFKDKVRNRVSRSTSASSSRKYSSGSSYSRTSRSSSRSSSGSSFRSRSGGFGK
ncbi:hypothetical protein [Fulvivirga sediminis]|uniref:Uncharacterized protein n=1 Tax=Fulvivirga sediminis TaxID=2803949 RepID=A0A937K0L0_9BACT|nr:hypothetical protein [Fulvivirga sediminis]MBL3658463.1 hypothetical protein [Fulvivirga sediminis]